MRFFKLSGLLCLLSLSSFSCDKKGDIPDKDVVETAINNTVLNEGTTLYGMITDQQGNPVKDVVVTDGFSCTLTDGNGVYQLVRHKMAKFVYYSTPSVYKIAVDGDNYPRFFEQLNAIERKIRKDFVLDKITVEHEFTLFCVADPQCRTPNEVSRYRTETLADIDGVVSNYSNVYSMTLGDIIFDVPALWNDMKASMANQRIPFFQTIGNHDHLATAPNDAVAVENFQSFFGPTDYSFNRGDVHIISMDNVIYTGNQVYTGGFSADQWKWLQEDLSYVPKDKMVILNVHIPVRSGGQYDHREYRQEVLNLLATYAEAHIMVGHTHYQTNYLHQVGGKVVYEHVHGAASGAWWNSTLCADGTPNGYAIYEISGNTMKNWLYKSTGYSVDFQIRAYDATHVFGPANKYTYWFGAPANLNLAEEGWIVANVWNADPGWNVALYQDGTKVTDMQRVSTRDFWVLYHHLEVLGKARGSDFDKVTDHFYIGRLSGPVQSADFEIVARDRFDNTYRTTELRNGY